MRLFFGVPLDAEARRLIVEWSAMWRRELPKIRWVEEDALHVTVVFLGEVPDARLEEVESAADAAIRSLPETGPMTAKFSLAQPGVFVHPPRAVLWLGVDDPGWISAAARSLGRSLAHLSEEAARDMTRSFTPHVTLARARIPYGGGAEAHRILDRFAASAPPDVKPQSAQVVLFRSDLNQGGAKHARIRAWAL
jgi:2'-5' RNA ligase